MGGGGGGPANAGGGRGGAFVQIAGSAGVGAFGGRSPGCMLEPGRCRLPNDIECEGSNPLCQGALEGYAILRGEQVWVTALGASRTDDRIAVAGSFMGTFGFGSQNPTSVELAAFVTVIDGNAQPIWTRKLDNPRGEGASAIAFTTEGRVVIQGADAGLTTGIEPRAFAAGFSPDGELEWRHSLDSVLTGKVAAGPKGDAWISGNFIDRLTFGETSLTHSGSSGYLIRLDPAGNVVRALSIAPQGCASTVLTDLAADDAGQPLIAGNCTDDAGVVFAFVQQLDVNGAIVFEKRFRGTFSFALGILRTTVDHSGRVTVGSYFRHSFEDGEGNLVYASNLDLATDLWMAQYAPSGERIWFRTFASTINGENLSSLASDPFDDIVALGTCSELSFGNTHLVATHQDLGLGGCILKLRNDGTPIWGHLIEGTLYEPALAVDRSAHIWLGGHFLEIVLYENQTIEGKDDRLPEGLLLRLTP